MTDREKFEAGENKMLSMPERVTAQDMRETLNILLHEEEAEAAATGFNQCLMECEPIYAAYTRRSRCIDELVKELDAMQESLNAKHLSFIKQRNRADLAERKLAALASQQPEDDGWVEWGGGERPVDCALVDVKFAGGHIVHGYKPQHLDWRFDGDIADIIAYRVVKP